MALDNSDAKYALYDLQNARKSCINPFKFDIWWVRLGKLQRLCTENGVLGDVRTHWTHRSMSQSTPREVYPFLVHYTDRPFRERKGAISAELTGISTIGQQRRSLAGPARVTRQSITGRRFGTVEEVRQESTLWCDHSNARQRRVDWQFKLDDARLKLRFPDTHTPGGPEPTLRAPVSRRPHSSNVPLPKGFQTRRSGTRRSPNGGCLATLERKRHASHTRLEPADASQSELEALTA